MKKIFISSLLITFATVFLVGCDKNETVNNSATNSAISVSDHSSEESSTTESTTTESITATTTNLENKTIETTIQKSTVQSTVASSTIEPTLADFVGGWGLPQTDILFFIANDGSFATATAGPNDNPPSYPNYSFRFNTDGKPVMTMTSDTGTTDFILEPDGTLTIDGNTYIYLGNYTREGFTAAKIAEYQAAEQEHAATADSTSFNEVPMDSFGAIESAKSYLAGGGNTTQFDNYTFTDTNGLMTDESGRSYYSIMIRQNGGNGMKSMAIGIINVYTDNGECVWQ